MGITIVALLIAACGPAAAPTTTATTVDSYAITDVNVVDVEQGAILPDQTVIIEDKLIRAVGPRTELIVPDEARVVDGRGLYLMPGLVDALGNEGWELVHMQPVYVGSNADVLIHSLNERLWSNAYFCVFKRPRD
jgi:hypothetical protein